MVRLRRDGVVLADEVSDGLQQLHDVRPLVAVRYRGVVPEMGDPGVSCLQIYCNRFFHLCEKCDRGPSVPCECLKFAGSVMSHYQL